MKKPFFTVRISSGKIRLIAGAALLAAAAAVIFGGDESLPAFAGGRTEGAGGLFSMVKSLLKAGCELFI